MTLRDVKESLPVLKSRLIFAALLLILFAAGGTVYFLNAKENPAAVNAPASQSFGEALERAGISSQAEPSR
jgi:hypothetical protein